MYVSCHLKSERSPYIALRSWTIVLAQQNFSHNLVSSLTLPVLIARDPMMTRYNSFERVSTCSMLERLMCRNCLRVYCEPYHVGHQPRTRSILKKSSEGQERGLGQHLTDLWIQNGRQGLEMYQTLGYWTPQSTFAKWVFWFDHSVYENLKNPKCPPGEAKMADKVWEGVYP